MTDQDFRFCPRCGTELVAGHRFCSKCGFDMEGLASAPPVATVSGGDTDTPRSPAARTSAAPIVIAALIVGIGIAAFAFLSRPQGSVPVIGIPGGGQPGTTMIPSAPIMGLSIQSPHDGETVATKDVTVIGLAPPGLRVTRDVSFGLDQHATADGTGHWAIGVTLNDGQNELVFRLGDDRSTEQRLHVTYSASG